MKRIALAVLLGAAGQAAAAEHSHPDHDALSIDHHHGGGSHATAELVALSGSPVKGMLHLVQHDNSNVLIKGSVAGLTPGKHGFHVHVNGNCDSPDGMSAGGHFAPTGGLHGAPSSQVHHLGDLGNNSLVNRAIVIHAKEDDFSDPAGNSGARVACGVIEQDNDMRM
ncbi:MAG: superoxide dismutase family protein [Thiobacillus sp.]|nr:superoxide dismutase family protein [Thiobacillus sp.]